MQMQIDEEKVVKFPNLDYQQWVFLCKQPDDVVSKQEKTDLQNKLMEIIKADNMTNFYQYVSDELKWNVDKALLEEFKTKNAETLKKLEEGIANAKENFGESEVREAQLAKAHFYATIGDKENAIKEYKATETLTVGAGQKLDVVLTQIRVGLFWMDHDIISRHLEVAKGMIDAGSDWDRKNRLKVYEAVYLMSTRKFKEAATVFLETIATFTALELLDYDTYIFYTVLMAVVSLDRVTLKSKVLNAPEILQVIDKMPDLKTLMQSLYSCNYGPFFKSLVSVTEQMSKNRLLHAHAGYYCKELRVKGYAQLLESYKSVQLNSMAKAFGISAEFLDKEISRFIASGRLHCKIDKVAGIIETTRPDSKNSQYMETIKQGDALLNRIQKLSRVINL
eukprot:TRINITY_DN11199_c0_g1_i1.p1 TRINITY_DN11199_c0_g1~~TRINITY_DN11199_c0_g1_i1.p1  ORF type:complete len:393 (+),score=103.70 TRINITY_DN11199_c0_g1_i1:131-1309(+)